jgi:L-alanine-DL-glutamate epimerase-like enolase superfamily enzyme
MALLSIIERIDSYVVEYDIEGHFRFFRGAPGARVTRPTVIVRIADHEGRVGWGQSVPSPTWSYETIDTVRTTIDRHLAPALVGCDAFESETIQERMHRAIAGSFSIGQPVCKAGVDLALFDLTGRILDQSAAERWGRQAKRREAITLSWTMDAHSLEDVDQQVSRARRRGYSHFNVKVGRDTPLDIKICKHLRRVAPDAFLWADANGGYSLEDALNVARHLAEAGFAGFEQPVAANRLSWFRRVKELGALPILMDEGVLTCVELAEFHQLGMLDGVAMKVARCGGLLEAQKMVEYIQQEGLLLFASGITDPDLSLAASLLLFAAYGLERPAALNAAQYLRGSILHSPLDISGDQARVPQGVGLGVNVDETAVVRLSLEAAAQLGRDAR